MPWWGGLFKSSDTYRTRVSEPYFAVVDSQGWAAVKGDREVVRAHSEGFDQFVDEYSSFGRIGPSLILQLESESTAGGRC